MRIFSSADRRIQADESSTDGSAVSQARAAHSVSTSFSSHDDHYVHGFVPEYILEEITQRTKDPIVLSGVQQARQDMRQVDLSRDPDFLKAQELYERVYINGEDPSNLSYQEQAILSKFFDWLKRLFDSIFGKKSPAPTPTPGSNDSGRYVYDAKGTQTLRYTLARSEGQWNTNDKDVDKAYDYAGELRTFMKDILKRNSIDNNGMQLHQTVHYGKNYANAFWNGKEMAYGDGDGQAFGHFAQDSTVIHHELGHGIVQHHNKNGGLRYYGESGALNESFADIMAVTMLQYMSKTEVQASSRDMWLIGAKTMIPYQDKAGSMQYPALRSFLDEKAYKDHPLLGTDRQPKHMKDKYTGSGDNGGVHINSGISNHAFYLASQAVGGKAWATTFQVWYKALAGVPNNCTFEQYALATVESAIQLQAQGFEADVNELKKEDVQKIIDAWKAVGVLTDKQQTKIDRIFAKYGFTPPKVEAA